MTTHRPLSTTRTASALIALVLLAFVAAGCGSKKQASTSGSLASVSSTPAYDAALAKPVKTKPVGNSNTTTPVAAFLAYVDSAAGHDFVAVCGRMTPTMQRATVTQIARMQASKAKPKGFPTQHFTTCATAAGAELSAIGAQWDALRKFTQTAKTTIKGDKAQIKNQQATIYLTKISGHWLLDQP